MRASDSFIQNLRDPERVVRVYTFQHRDAYAVAQQRGFFTGSEEHALDDDPWGWTEQYQWMREQMQQRIPHFSGDYPMWAYVVRPNLRQSTYHPDSVLIVADVPRWRMLISDHSTWHLPLNRWFVSRDEAEDDALRAVDKEAGLNRIDAVPRPLTDAMKASWERIFEIGEPSPAERAWLGPRNDLQACVDRIHLHEIVRVTERPGRLGKRGGGIFRPRHRNAESQPEGLA